MEVTYSARSHVGRIRENNEDNLYVDGVILTPDIRERPFTIDGTSCSTAVFAVCDGMGGEEDGEVASLLAAHSLLAASEKIKVDRSGQLNEIVQSYVNDVNASIRSKEEFSGKRTGTTLALAVAGEYGVYCFNIGDSRIYSLQRNIFKQISKDHTLIAEQMRNCNLSMSQAASVKGGNKLTRCIGIGEIQTVESCPPILGNCRILVCSDGLTDMVSVTVIEKLLRISERTAAAADALLSLALENGGRDNVTIIVMDIKGSKIPFLRSIAKKLKGQGRS